MDCMKFSTISRESNNSSLNYPERNVYGINKLLMSDILMKNKRKYPENYGNNIENPEYLRIDNLKNNNIVLNRLPKYLVKKKYLLPIKRVGNSEDKSTNKKHYDITNKQTEAYIGRFIDKPKYKLQNQRSYNILSNHDRLLTEPATKIQQNYFRHLCEIKIMLEGEDKKQLLVRYNNNHRLNDGIYDYLKEHNLA